MHPLLNVSQIASLQVPTYYGEGAIVPGRGWIIFGGNTTFNQTQHLRSIDDTWTIGDPSYQPDIGICIVQVEKHITT